MRPSSLRRNAFEKLAALSAVHSNSSTTGNPDFARLAKRCDSTGHVTNDSGTGQAATSKVPMGLPELEALLALCKAAPLVLNTKPAAQLLQQLSPYLPESHTQAIAPAPSLQELDPSPWEVLTFSLASAVLSLGSVHSSLRSNAAATVWRYVEAVVETANSLAGGQAHGEDDAQDNEDGQPVKIVVLTISLLGFLDAAAKHASFWTAQERLRVITTVREALSEEFMVALETALSVIRNAHGPSQELKDWRRYCKQYAVAGWPLGAMLLRQRFMQLVVASASLLVASRESLADQSVLDVLQHATRRPESQLDHGEQTLLEGLAEIASDEIMSLEEGSSYLEVGSAWHQTMAFSVKANALICFLCCAVRDEETADPETLMSWLESILADPVQLADEALASVVLRSMTILAKRSPAMASNLSRFLPRVLVQGGLESRTAVIAADSLASTLKLLPQDATITTLYSLGNILSATTGADRSTTTSPWYDSNMESTQQNGSIHTHHNMGSAISLAASDIEEPSSVYTIVVRTIVGIAGSRKDDKITALALSMLVQKIGRVSPSVDAMIVTEAAALGVYCGPTELRSLLKLYGKLCRDSLIAHNTVMLDAVMNGRKRLSSDIKSSSPLYETYLLHQLETIVSKGDAHESDNSRLPDVELAAQEIAQLLPPLATFVSENAGAAKDHKGIEGLFNMQRDAWFNIVVHGFDLSSPLGKQYFQELRLLARYSQPLVAEDRVDRTDSDIELNTVLRRGKSTEHASEHKKRLMRLLPSCEPEIRSLNYSEVIFLSAASLVETLRAISGDCTKVLQYFLEPRLRSGDMGKCMSAIATGAVNMYLSKTLTGNVHTFSAPYVAQQLALLLAGCCHRISRVQQAATACVELVVDQVPSALCYKSSLFALLELLTIMWAGCLEKETDEYEWKSKYNSPIGNTSIELPDDYNFRRSTLTAFYKLARKWVTKVLDIAPLDIKGLLQTYLSEYNDEGVYGHVALGRSFALEMGSKIPSTDQRLGAIEVQQGVNINTASDFLGQYTTRQEYRFVDSGQDADQERLQHNGGGASIFTISGVRTANKAAGPLKPGDARGDQKYESAEALLMDLESRTHNNKHVSITELRDILRRAGALLCKANSDQCAIAHHLVGVPFAVFTKQAIKLGITLWTGVIKENPRMESRILVEIAENWENTVRQKRGLFHPHLRYQDPFYTKAEFAPSDREAITKRQQHVYNMLAPHYRLTQFLSSHFNATRLGNPHLQKVYHRLVHITLDAMESASTHPLAREVYFHIVLLALRILRFSTDLDASAQWRMKDRILSAGLRWFRAPPRWSFGGNRLQVKAETHLLADVQSALQHVAHIGSKTVTSLKLLQAKQDLLSMLLTSEHGRLMVWLYPLNYERKHHLTPGHHNHSPTDAALSAAVKAAWAENPSLAVYLVHRFHSPTLAGEVRWLLLNFPEKATHEPDALELLLGPSLPNDVSFQLKYLLYWAPVNPITAVTYFLPAYGNHPFIIQYAMRALESHPIDVTFFYVPQIVQALRYDVLGYVERYIVETGKVSQLFAHQIIWNMKANAYKDEDSEIPDPVKPTLDKVMDKLISSFAKPDREFYEREFSFFNEVTGISGKLKPFIKKSKPEKKQKIEEELRKIKVEVGVYLPSNPDGVVIGIDRKSGKPLQSHAKAPYMATFRIRKEKEDDAEQEKDSGKGTANGEGSHKNTYEIWQSAIFKVGDDCRQDVLALQMIAAFRGIFNNVGLDVYVYPYRVTATAPGCGVIDVLPNSISRDMLGREQVNGLYEYFVSKYGGEDSIRFQEARNNFVKSMAAYSVISYLLQFKDRHNGNIMIDDAGHILHIDFGFCFDIAPGGVRFERAPFKLTGEMVAVMGGSTDSQSYRWFEELCIKAFLASRQHVEHLAHIVICMLDSGLPCFKPQTVQHFKERFVLQMGEGEAAGFMKDLIRKSERSYSTKGYDQFQLLTNGIPY